MEKKTINKKKEVIKALKNLLAPVLESRGGNKPLCKLEYNYLDSHIVLNYLSYRTYQPSQELEKFTYKLLVHYDLSIQSDIKKILNRTILIMIDQLVSKEQDLNCISDKYIFNKKK